MNYYYYYEVKFYFDNEICEAQGITHGTSFPEAVSHIGEAYDENAIIAINKMMIINDGGSCVEINEINDNIESENIQVQIVKNPE